MLNTQKILAVAFATSLVGCAAKQKTFSLSSAKDNDKVALQKALAKMSPRADGPMNDMGKPVAFMVARKKSAREIVAYDLNAKSVLWRKSSDVRSRIVVSQSVLSHLEGEHQLVGRTISSGEQRWAWTLPGELVGAAADKNSIYATVKTTKSKRDKTWALVAIDASTGKEKWRADSNGALGTPGAMGGLVFSPYLKQWLSILDAKTGKQLARIKGEDQEISFIKANHDGVYFGSKNGVFALDAKAASGKTKKSTYGEVVIPEELPRLQYFADSFDPVQAGYSAYDRNRVLWDAEPGQDTLGFASDSVVLQSHRFFFGMNANDGKLNWAYNHPKVDVVASGHQGSSIGLLSMLGDVVALDAQTGTPIYQASLEGQFLGATFDAAGWSPSGEVAAESKNTGDVLVSIAGDKDARYADAKKYAISQLSKVDSPSASTDLIGLLKNPKTSPSLYQTAAEKLADNNDPKTFEEIVGALNQDYDFVASKKAYGISALAKALRLYSQNPKNKVRAQSKGTALEALKYHLENPQTSSEDLVEVMKAYVTLGNMNEVAAVSSMLLLSRMDGAFDGSEATAMGAIDALVELGGGQGRETVAYVAQDPSTSPAVLAYANKTLGESGVKVAEATTPISPDKGADKQQ